MKWNKLCVLALFNALLGSFINTNIYAQKVKKVGTSAAAFLRIPVGSRAIGMGSAFVSISDDGSAMYWNPGGVARCAKKIFFVDHSPYLPGIDYHYLGLILPLGVGGSMGINITSLISEDMDVTTPEFPMGTGDTFNAASTSLGVAYAYNLTDRFSIGVNVKYIQENIYHCRASGFAFDIGTLFQTPFKDIKLGVNVSNVGTKMRITGEDLNSFVDVAPTQEGNNDNIGATLKTDAFTLPIIMRCGISWDVWQNENSRLTFAGDGINPNDNAPSMNLGIEFSMLKQILAIRGGFNDLFLMEREKGLTVGAGLRVPIINRFLFSASYAYQDFKYLGGVNHFSIEIHF